MRLFQMIVVDDEQRIRAGLVKNIHWEALGFEVVGAFGSGAEAIAYLAHSRVDVVFTDIVMKNGTGIDIAEWVNVHKPGIQVVLLTGFSDFDTARRAVACKVVRYLLTKPTDIGELKAVFAQVHAELMQRCDSMALSGVVMYLDAACAEARLPVVRLSGGMEVDGSVSGSIGNRVAIWCCPASYAEELTKAVEHLQAEEPLLGDGKICCFETLPDMLQTLSEPQGDSGRRGSWDEQSLREQIQNAFEACEYQRLDELFSQMQTQDAPEHVVLFAAYVVDLNYCMYCAREGIREEREIRAHLIAVMEGRETAEHLTRCVHALVDSCQRHRSRGSDHLLAFVDDYLENHLTGKASLQEIAQQMYFNAGYLGRLFKEREGKSFTEYEIEFKMRKAAAMLEDTNLRVKEIGQRVGYSDTQYFSETFRDKMGMTPTEYRKNLPRR